MSTAAISPSLGNYTADFQSALTQRRNDFKALGQALRSGDIAGAQAAFTALQADDKNSATVQSAQSSGNPQSASGGQPGDLFAQLAQALAAGDLAGAQKAFASLQALGHHGHHHHPATAATGSPANAAGGDGSGQSASGRAGACSTGNVIDTSA